MTDVKWKGSLFSHFRRKCCFRFLLFEQTPNAWWHQDMRVNDWPIQMLLMFQDKSWFSQTNMDQYKNSGICMFSGAVVFYKIPQHLPHIRWASHFLNFFFSTLQEIWTHTLTQTTPFPWPACLTSLISFLVWSHKCNKKSRCLLSSLTKSM